MSVPAEAVLKNMQVNALLPSNKFSECLVLEYFHRTEGLVGINIRVSKQAFGKVTKGSNAYFQDFTEASQGPQE